MAKKPYNIDNITLKIATRIKKMRVDAGYTSYENFALDNNFDRKQYWRAEKGYNLTLKSLLLILNKHKISLEDFFKDL